MLRFFNTTAADYAVIFTPNATGACRLVAESYPWRRRTRFGLTADNHNSVHGISGIGVDLIHQRVSMLTGWLLECLGRLRHSTGAPLVQLYGPSSVEARGATVALNFLDPEGRVVDERAVARDAADAGISLRTGCFCKPGAGERTYRDRWPGTAGLSPRHSC